MELKGFNLAASLFKTNSEDSKPIIQFTNSQLYGSTIQENQKLNISFKDEFGELDMDVLRGYQISFTGPQAIDGNNSPEQSS